ncbi:hypothetical protein AWM68_15920 [Fictibacillus phosphorivorans]|uniref:Uncharacterized protein n=1 Tax=Fictibacillus phosphorivorans TaxID=1221500 RepID=A0A163PB47_9BACL|nr:hypothetical protein AWM68_15920 [Fictibacillus phosphorivorans]
MLTVVATQELSMSLKVFIKHILKHGLKTIILQTVKTILKENRNELAKRVQQQRTLDLVQNT